MFNNQGFVPGYTGQYVQAPTPQDTKSYCQTLSVEMANALRQQIEEFSLQLSEKDKWIAWCVHRDPSTGASTLIENKMDDTVTCSICGKTFRPLNNLLPEDIQNAVDNIEDIIQTIKMLYLDMPPESARSFFTILALIDKIPGLFKISNNNFLSHEEQYNRAMVNNGPGMISAWRALNNGGFNGYYMPGYYNPMMGGAMPYQQPMMNPGYAGYGAPVAPGGNPFMASPQQPTPQPMMQPTGQTMVYGMGQQPAPQPMMGQPQPTMYTPQMQQYAYMPTPSQATQAATVAPAPVAPVDPSAVAPAQATATTDGSTVAITQTFQA